MVGYFKKDDMTPNTKSYGNSFFWTLALAAIFMGLFWVPLPTAVSIYGVLFRMKGDQISQISILAMGLGPIIDGFLIAEIFSLIIKPMARWRLEGTTGREKINFCAFAITLVITLIRALGNSYSVKVLVGSYSPYYSSPLLFHFLNVVTLTAGTFLALWIAQLITRFGVGNGFLVLLLAEWFEGLCRHVSKHLGEFVVLSTLGYERFMVLVIYVLFAVIAVFLWKFIAKAPRIPMKLADRKRLWYEISPFPSGLEPHYAAITTLSTTYAFFTFAEIFPHWLKQGWPHIAFECVLIVPLGLLFYNWIYGDIDVFGLSVGNLPTYLKRREKILDKQFLKGIAVLLAGSFLFWMPLDKNIGSLYGITSLGSLIFLLAVVRDFWAQWEFWRFYGPGVELLEMDNVHLASYLKGLFQAEGISFYIQAYGYRRLLFWFDPLYKMRLLVPEEEVEKSRALLATVKYKVV